MNSIPFQRLRQSLQSYLTRRVQTAGKSGQAIVELALASTFIMMLIGAAVDMGMAYKAYQTLTNATAEAGSYLGIRPTENCGDPSCAMNTADATARERFRTEQGDSIRGMASTLDLNSNNVDDKVENLDLSTWIQIDEADNTQITDDGSFATVGASFNPTQTSTPCKQRQRYPNDPSKPLVNACYIVIRAQIIYKPFFLAPILGRDMTIRAISVRQVVEYAN